MCKSMNSSSGSTTVRSSTFATVRALLRDVLEARGRGESEKRLRSAHTFVDGYMRAMLDAELTTKAELLKMVAEERARLAGPASREVTDDGFEADEGQLPVHAPDESGVRPRRAQQVTAQIVGAARGAA